MGDPGDSDPCHPAAVWWTHWRVVAISFMQQNTHPAVRLCPPQAFPAGGSEAGQSRAWAGLQEGGVWSMCQRQWASEPVWRGRERGERAESLVRETKQQNEAEKTNSHQSPQKNWTSGSELPTFPADGLGNPLFPTPVLSIYAAHVVQGYMPPHIPGSGEGVAPAI